jgi:hypothetical protein
MRRGGDEPQMAQRNADRGRAGEEAEMLKAVRQDPSDLARPETGKRSEALLVRT